MMEYRVIFSRRKSVAVELARNGEVLVRAPYGFSRRRIEQLLSEKEDWILRHRERLSAAKKYPTDPGEIEELRRRAKDELIPKTWDMASRFGFAVKSVRITSAKTRFGSCSANDRISLSLFLMLYPPEAREYVILHELCHTVEHNHSRRFYALLDERMPDHRLRRRLLRQ